MKAQEWKDHFIREATHHIKKTKHHRAIAEHARKLMEMHKGKSDMEGLGEILESYIETHSAIADEHADYAEHCAECAKSLSNGTGARKAAGMENGDELMPTDVHAVVPDVPQNRAIPRFGQREIAQAVAPEFRKLVQVEDEE